MGQHNCDWWNGKVPVLWLWGSGCSMDLWHHHAFGGVGHGNEVICVINYSCGCSLGNLEWQDRMIFGWIVGWYPGDKGAVFSYMWNCIGCSFDYLRNLIECFLLIRVISFGYKFTRGNLFGYTYNRGGDGHVNGGFIYMFVVSRFASGTKYLVYCRVFTVM